MYGWMGWYQVLTGLLSFLELFIICNVITVLFPLEVQKVHINFIYVVFVRSGALLHFYKVREAAFTYPLTSLWCFTDRCSLSHAHAHRGNVKSFTALTLMVETEVSELLSFNFILTWLIAQEDFEVFIHCDSFKSWTSIFLVKCVLWQTSLKKLVTCHGPILLFILHLTSL
jgi:hypothetical protein